MYIQGALNIVFNAFASCKKLRNNPEFFQKVCQVACAALELKNPETKSLSKFAFALYTINAHDCLEFIQKPARWVLINADAIDAGLLLERLIEITGLNADDLEGCLEAQLKSMYDNNDYFSEEEFKTCLRNWIENNAEHILPDGVFNNLEIPYRSVSHLKKFIEAMWVIVNIECLALCLDGWNLVSLAKHANTIGQYRVFQWVANQQLLTWGAGFTALIFALQVGEAFQRLRNDPLNKKQAFGDMVTSLVESIYYGALCINRINKSLIGDKTILWLAIIAKSSGLIWIVIKPNHEYFQQ